MATAYCEIPLTKGLVALVDVEDYDELSQFRWRAQVYPRTVYTSRQFWLRDGSRRSEYMHRRIMGLKPGDPRQVDHINGDGRDNRRSNLRVASRAENMRNRHSAWGSSGYVGVSWHRRARQWQAVINVQGRNRHLGYFRDPAEAARARDLAALQLHGEFARLNFPVTEVAS